MGGGGGVLEGQWAATPFALFLVQAVVIIALSRGLALLLRYVKQPAVVSEMIAGILLGPSALGRIPGFTDSLFPSSSLTVLSVIAQVGLVLYLFTVGLELDPKTLRGDLKMSLWISAWGLVIPFIGAMMQAAGLYADPEYSHTSFILMSLFLTCALGISALPVLARILAERGMLHSRLGGLSMSVAAIDDVAAWCLVAVLLTLVRSPTALGILWTALLATSEILALIFIVRPLLGWLIRRNTGPELSTETFLYVCLILLIFAYVAEIIGLSALIGAFQVGLVIPRHGNVVHQLAEKLEAVTAAIFMPIYFASSGLKTQFGLINDGASFGLAVLVVFVATITKIIGIMIPCWWLKFPCRMNGVIAVLMSCKGLIALIIVTYGLDLGIITRKFFAILVLMVLVTTIQTVPLVLCVDPPSRAAQSARESAAWEAAQNQAREAAAAAAQAKRVAAGASGGASLSWFPFRRRARASSWPRDAAAGCTARSTVLEAAADDVAASPAQQAVRGRGRWAGAFGSRRELSDGPGGSSSPSGATASVIPVTGNVAHRESITAAGAGSGGSMGSARSMSPSRVIVHNPLRSQPSPPPPPPSSQSAQDGSDATASSSSSASASRGAAAQHLPGSAGFADGVMSSDAAAAHASAGLPSAVARARLSLYRPPPPPPPFSPADDGDFAPVTV